MPKDAETMRCKQCGALVIKGKMHKCPTTGVTYDTRADNSGDFFTSMMIGMITNNAMLGGMIGGNWGGAMLGDIMNDGVLGAAQHAHPTDATHHGTAESYPAPAQPVDHPDIPADPGINPDAVITPDAPDQDHSIDSTC